MYDKLWWLNIYVFLAFAVIKKSLNSLQPHLFFDHRKWGGFCAAQPSFALFGCTYILLRSRKKELYLSRSCYFCGNDLQKTK